AERTTRDNLVVRDPDGVVRGWVGAHDRAAGRMLLTLVVDPMLEPAPADAVARVLLRWADDTARRIGAERGLDRQQIDSGAFADDPRQHRWLEQGGFDLVRTWWQMTRPTAEGDAERDTEAGPGVRIRRVRRQGSGMPDEDDLRVVHDVLESAFADHFNSHEETFDEFLSRLREDPGHRWDHWWVAELVGSGGDGDGEEGGDVEGVPAGALVGSVSGGEDGQPAASYVEYIGVLQSARGRGVAKSLLNTVIADAAAAGRSGVGLEVDADSPTGADALYVALGWRTDYVTQSWHRTVPIV
ncbi:MAG: GNAT family N-acetyltransferase, partial [Nocardioidaceae bacterium]